MLNEIRTSVPAINGSSPTSAKAPFRTPFADPKKQRTFPKVGAVLIVDDCPIVRFGMRSLLTNFCLSQRINEAEPHAVLRYLQGGSWDTVILGFGAGDGMRLLQTVQSRQPAARILLLSTVAEPQYAIKALRAGAAGYLVTRASTAEILNAITVMVEGESHVSPSLAVKLAQGLGDSLSHENLSRREFDVLLGIARGERLAHIAAAMNLNAKTVSTYRRRVLTKMGLGTDAELVTYCVRHALISGA